MKTICYLLFLSTLYYNVAHADTDLLKWKCKTSIDAVSQEDTCDIYFIEDHTAHLIITLPPKWMRKTHINYYSANLAEIKTDYERDTHGSFFFEFSTQKESRGYEVVFLVDPVRNLVVAGNEDGIVLTSIIATNNLVKQILIPRNEISWNTQQHPLNRVQINFKNNKINITYIDKTESSRTRVFNLPNFVPLDKPIMTNDIYKKGN